LSDTPSGGSCGLSAHSWLAPSYPGIRPQQRDLSDEGTATGCPPSTG